MTPWDWLVCATLPAHIALCVHLHRSITKADRRRAAFWAFYEDSLRAHGIKTTHMVSLPGGKQ